MPGNAANVGAAVIPAWLALLSAGLASGKAWPICTVAVNGCSAVVATVKLMIIVCCDWAAKRPRSQLTAAPLAVQGWLALAKLVLLGSVTVTTALSAGRALLLRSCRL